MNICSSLVAALLILLGAMLSVACHGQFTSLDDISSQPSDPSMQRLDKPENRPAAVQRIELNSKRSNAWEVRRAEAGYVIRMMG